MNKKCFRIVIVIVIKDFLRVVNTISVTSCLIQMIRYKTENLFGVFVTERRKCYGLAEITSREGLVQGIK